MQHSLNMIDLSKKIEDLSGDELRELKDESDRVVAAIRELHRKFDTLRFNKQSARQFPKDFKGHDGATYRWKESTMLVTVTEKVNDAVVE
jgi:hypothetical protein